MIRRRVKRLFPAVLAALALAACEARFDDEMSAGGAPPACEPVMFEDSPFTLCIAEPGRHTIRTDLAPAADAPPYRSLEALARGLGETAQRVAFATNGGMYDAEGQPIGYYVEDGLRFTVLNQNEGPGNFHLLPNGVFFGEAGGPWRVLATEDFAREIDARPEFATQSGPMLVVDGELHEALDPDGPSRKIRNAVGVDANGRALFVISEAPVSFGKLARFYRDVLNTENALFLDGSVSALWDPARDRRDGGAALGPLIVVENRAQAAP